MIKTLLFLSCTLMTFSCIEDQTKKEKPFDKGKLYRVYFHVSRDINENEEVEYHYDYTPLTTTQRDTLINVLKSYGAKYKLCYDSTIMVSIISVPDAVNMSGIDDELKKRLGKKGYVWGK